MFVNIIHSYSAMDALAILRGQLEEKGEEIEQLQKMNNGLQQSLTLLQDEHDQLKQENQNLMEDSRKQVGIMDSFVHICLLA